MWWLMVVSQYSSPIYIAMAALCDTVILHLCMCLSPPYRQQLGKGLGAMGERAEDQGVQPLAERLTIS